uniref:CSON000616 protein n=1 Tax=Culicoides sonorensis TaxID=179676 RepID=A0A336MJA3_CULSO
MVRLWFLVNSNENPTEIQATAELPGDLFENAKYHGKRKALVGSILKDPIPFTTHFENTSNRRIFILRHGERVDHVFPGFETLCFDEAGNYTKKDLNMPKCLPERENPAENWKRDSPLTNLGLYQAELVGKSMLESGQTFDTVLCSPSYRCIQTCDTFLNAMQLRDKVKICVEPALYEWIGWLPLIGLDELGDFFTPEQLLQMGFNIDTDYNPILTINDLKARSDESFDSSIDRNHAPVQEALKNTNCKNLLIVGHGSSLLVNVLKFISSEKNNTDILNSLRKGAYCGIVGIEEDDDHENWKWITPPLVSLTHGVNGDHGTERLLKFIRYLDRYTKSADRKQK